MTHVTTCPEIKTRQTATSAQLSPAVWALGFPFTVQLPLFGVLILRYAVSGTATCPTPHALSETARGQTPNTAAHSPVLSTACLCACTAPTLHRPSCTQRYPSAPQTQHVFSNAHIMSSSNLSQDKAEPVSIFDRPLADAPEAAPTYAELPLFGKGEWFWEYAARKWVALSADASMALELACTRGKRPEIKDTSPRSSYRLC